MNGIGQVQQQQLVPGFPTLPNRDTVCSSVEKDQKDLDAALLNFDEFFVTTSEKQDHLKSVVQDWESGRCVVKSFAWASRVKPDRCKYNLLRLLKQLLKLGLNPDRVDDVDGFTPSHFCSFWGNWEVAEVLVLCRPNLKAKDKIFGWTPFTLAGREATRKDYADPDEVKNYHKVADIFEKADLFSGFPTIAELARKEKFWAVQNLVRRGVVPDFEKFEKSQGKTAIEWAEFHNETGLAEELRFLLGDQQAIMEKNLTFLEAQNEELEETLAVAFSNLTEEKEVLKEQVALLERQLAEAKDETNK